MSNTGLAVFDETIQLTNIWLKDLMEDLEWEDRISLISSSSPSSIS